MAVESVRIIIEVSGEDPLEVDLALGAYVLGREEGCELFIENDGISRQHARLTVSDSGLTAEDLGSSNGSFLAGEQLTEPVNLQTGETLVLGANAISVYLAEIRESSSEVPGSVDTMPLAGGVSAEAESTVKGELNLFDANYHFREEIARGGMGAVIEADDQNTGRTVAIKTMLADGGVTEESKHRFLQEARVMGHLEHPNIVPMHELALDDLGMPYYTMKRIQGTDLQDVLTRIKNGDEETIAAYPLRTLLGIFLKVCDAMAFAHSKGVIHRDLKPENIMLGEFGEVLVADWGLAKILPQTPLAFLHMAVEEGTEISEDEVSEEGSFKTMEGSVMGTPNFMAPEQAEGKTAEIDRLSDIFSLGGILYSILTLRPPVLGKTVSEVLENMRSAYIAPPVLYNKVKSAKLIGRGKRAEEEVHLYHCPGQQIPDSLSRVAMHAMNLERKERYQKVQDFQKDIEAWQLGYATTAEEADFWRQVVLFVSRNKAATIVGCLVALIGTTMIGWSLVADSKARAAMAEMKTAVPLIEGELQNTIDSGQFDRALARLDSLVILMPDNPGYRLKRAQIFQSMLQFDMAADEFETAGSLEGDAEKYLDDITFSRDLMKAAGTDGLDDRSFEQFVNRLDRDERFAEARFHRGRRIAKGREQLASIRPTVLKLVDEKAGLLIASTFALAAAESGAALTVPPTPDAHWDFEFDARDRVGDLDLDVRPGARVEDGHLHLRDKNGYALTELLSEGLDEYSIEIWADVIPGEEKGLELVKVQAGRNSFNVLSFNLRGEGNWGFRWRRPEMQAAALKAAAIEGMTQFVLTVGRDAVQVYFGGTNTVLQNTTRRYRDHFFEFAPNVARITFGHAASQSRTTLKGRIAEARLFRRVITAAEVDALRRSNPLNYDEAALTSQLDSQRQQRLAAIEEELAAVTTQVKALNRLVGAETSEAMVRSYRQLMKENGAPQLAVDRLKLDSNGRLSLELIRLNLERIDWLEGIPLSNLDIRGNPVSDLGPLRGMPLTRLLAGQTQVSRLEPLAGMALEQLVLANTQVGDITPLQGMPLRKLNLQVTKVSDLSPLVGAPLEELVIHFTQVGDLTPLKGMPLKHLNIGGCPGIDDISVLADSPLEKLEMWGHDELRDLSPLAGMQLKSFMGGNFESVTNWNVLAAMPLRSFVAGSGSLRDYSILAGKNLDKVSVDRTKGTDFSVFREMQPKYLDFSWTALKDLSDLGGTNHAYVNISGTPVTDLSPLRGRKIDELFLNHCNNIRDVSPLMECKVKLLVVPPKAAGTLAMLRNHPTITHIVWSAPNYDHWDKNRWNKLPSKEEFWRAWDEGKRKP